MARAKDTCISGYQAIDDLIQDSKVNEDYQCHLKWIPKSEFSDIQSIYMPPIDQKVSSAVHEVWGELILLLLNDCTPAAVGEFAGLYLLPTYKYKKSPNGTQFKRHSIWLQRRNRMIEGFTEYDNKYYLVAKRQFLYCYSLYGFCSVCGILRCSPVWCICGHKELSNTWSSGNKKLDDIIKKSQIQTNSANNTYLEWIPFDYIKINEILGYQLFNYLPTNAFVTLIPFDIENETDNLYKVIFNYVYEYITYICCFI
jgi:hypothetical protein